MCVVYILQNSELKSSSKPDNSDDKDVKPAQDKPVDKKKSATTKYVAEEETFHGFEVSEVTKFAKKAKKAIKKINHVMKDYNNEKVDELDVQMKIPTGKYCYLMTKLSTSL